MEVYREIRTIDRPPVAVARTVFGDGDAGCRTETVAGLYRVETTLDVDDGSLHTTVAVPAVGVLTALAVLAATLGIASPGLRLVALWLCAAAVVAPLGHLLPGLDARPAAGRVVDRWVSPATAPAFAAAIWSLWLTLAPGLGAVAGALCGTFVLVGAACYAAGAGWRTAPSTLWLPAAGLLPVLSTVGGYAVVLALADQGAADGVRAGLAVAGLSVVIVVAYSHLVCRTVATARFEPLSAPGRRVLLAGYLAVLVVLVGVLAGLGGRIAARHGPPVALGLAAPLAIPVGGWILTVARTAIARLAVLRRADRLTVDGVTLYVLAVERPRVAATAVPPGVVASRPVVDALATDELAAVVAHERHHLETQSLRGRLALGAAAVLVGRNPLAAFVDAPARERSADRHAVDRAGTAPLVRALRRLERLDAGGPPSPSPAAAPHALLFGHVADAAIYPSVDERIAAVGRESVDRVGQSPRPPTGSGRSDGLP
jgi:Zn-dependent protease with chaperone function